MQPVVLLEVTVSPVDCCSDVRSMISILNRVPQVSAEDKASGKVQQITITSEKGRLSDEEIERMVKESETFAEQDRQER